MSYDPNKQFRCPIVRGKAHTDLDNLLPIYAQIIAEVCPCDRDSFKSNFNEGLANHLSTSTEKTLNNHRTEIAGKLFGMYFEDDKEEVYPSPRTIKLLNDSDQPAFFKDLCLKYQFPSGMNKIHTVAEQVSAGINVRQLSLVMQVLLDAYKSRVELTKKEVGYYILNSFDALSNQANPSEILSQILHDRNNSIFREVSYEGKQSSYNHQHINEQLNLLVLANVISYVNDIIIINSAEMPYIEHLASRHKKKPEFDFQQFDLDVLEERKLAELQWNRYFSQSSNLAEKILTTRADALVEPSVQGGRITAGDTVALGNEGEEYVYNLERNRVEKFSSRLVSKVKKLGMVKGLGFDIQSVFAEGEDPEFAKYIEVKSTKRVTPPSPTFTDTVNLTRNEWMAAKQHRDSYFVYRVYFCRDKIKLFVIRNPFELNEKNLIQSVPTTYRMDFNQKSGVFQFE